MAESGAFEQVVTDIVARLVRDLDDVIALIQRPISGQADLSAPDLSACHPTLALA